MSRKLEIRTRMAEIQKEFSSLNEELKDMEHDEKVTHAREKYKDFKFKVGTYGYKVEPEDKVQEVTDEDREGAGAGRSGLVYTGFQNSDYGFIMMKERAEYPRVVRVCQIIDAVEHMVDEKVKDKEPYIKVILGEETK